MGSPCPSGRPPAGSSGSGPGSSGSSCCSSSSTSRRRRVGVARGASGTRCPTSRSGTSSSAASSRAPRRYSPRSAGRDPTVRLSGRRHVYGGARLVCDGGRAQQLRAREHRHVRDAGHVRRDRGGVDLAGVLAGYVVQKIFYLVIGTLIYVYLFCPVAGSFDFQFGNVRTRSLATSCSRSGSSGRALPSFGPAPAHLLAVGQGHVGAGQGRRRDPRRRRCVRAAGAAACRWAVTPPRSVVIIVFLAAYWIP